MDQITSSLDAQGGIARDSDQNDTTNAGLGDSSVQLLERMGLASELLASLQQDTSTTENLRIAQDKEQQAQNGALASINLKEDIKSGRIKVQSKQAISHSAFTELRIDALEKAVNEIKAHIYDIPKGHAVNEDIQYPIQKHEIRRSSFYTFKVGRQTYNAPVEHLPALEVLVSRSMDNTVLLPLDLNSNNTDSTVKSTVTKFETPERLRIRSQPLLHYLDKVLRGQVDISHAEDINDQRIYPATVFLRPFKLLVENEEQIHQSLLDLRSNLGKDQPQTNKLAGGSRHKQEGTMINEDIQKDLNLLVEFLDQDLKPTFDLRRHLADSTATDIEFADLWHLFRRGMIVISPSNETQAYRVINFTGGRELLRASMVHEMDRTRPGHNGFIIDCLALAYNGLDFVPKLHKFTIMRYSGSRSISSLPIFPLKFHENSQSLRLIMHSRARRFMEVTAPPFSHHMMTGKTVDEASHDVDGRVIIDMATAINTIPKWKLPTQVNEGDLTKVDLRETSLKSYCHHMASGDGCCGDDFVAKDLTMDQENLSTYMNSNSSIFGPRQATELEDDDLILLPDCVHGYVLRNRQWVTMRLSDISDIKFDNDFEDLILPVQEKKTILALMKAYETDKFNGAKNIGARLDLVKGKGSGLVVLLHGEPGTYDPRYLQDLADFVLGVGKTLTAECIADTIRRPLFPITCSNIGETASEIEVNLLSSFNLAHRWGCVLLLDEADVFFAKRNKIDLRRNAVITVFLRNLEYYTGIIFLTTNRVGAIDPAFKSRIHMSIFYPRLSKENTVKLYEIFIKRTKAEQARLGTSTFKINKKEITRFARHHYRRMEKDGLETWNGR